MSYIGWGRNFLLVLLVNKESSFKTDLDNVINPSQLEIKKLVSSLSKKRFSCGITLSVIDNILIFLFSSLEITPRHGAMNGNQYRMMTTSGFNLLIFLETENQFKGFIELISDLILILEGGSPSSYWVVPGNKNAGYCKEKEKIMTSSPLWWYVFANVLLKFAMPPLKGKAGPIIMIFLLVKI